MAKNAEFKIVINGIQESINAVDALNKQLDALENRIGALAKKNVSVSASGGASNTAQLKQEEKLLKQIEQLHKKVADTEKKEYQELLHAKEELKEYQQIAKAIAAEANISSGVNDQNTMLGMKQQLHDIKAAMQVVDVDSEKFKNMQKQANDLNAKLLQIEKGYGQFGRNVGNYANGVAEGMQKVVIKVGDTERVFRDAREASRTLNNELKAMALNGQQDTKEYHELNEAVKQMNSTIQDTAKSSVFMDNILDTMQGFTALSSIGVGFSNLFGIDDSDFNDTMQKFAALTLAMQGLEKMKQQMQTNEGMGRIFKVALKPIDALNDRITKYIDNLETAKVKASNLGKLMEDVGFKYSGKDKDTGEYVFTDDTTGGKSKIRRYGKKEREELYSSGVLTPEEVTMQIDLDKNIKGLERLRKAWTLVGSAAKMAGNIIKTVAGLGIGMVIMEALTKVMDTITDFIKSLNTTKIAAEKAAEGIKTINRQLEIQRDLLASRYMDSKQNMSDEDYLKGIYMEETKALAEQVELLKVRSRTLDKSLGTGGVMKLWRLFSAEQNTEFSGKKIQSGTTVGHGRGDFLFSKNDLQYTVNNIKEVEEAWRNCENAIKEGKDLLSYKDEGSWFSQVLVTMKDTEEVAKGLGNVALSDFVARFGELNNKYKDGKKDSAEYAAELRKLKKEMDGSEVLNSVIANLDKYIPDEGVREAVQNIINELLRLDDAFNMTSPQQVHFWNQVRIEGMKEGLGKEKAMIEENRRWDIQQYAHTEEQKKLINDKYNRQIQNAQDKANKEAQNKAKEHGKKLLDAENELIALRIENMKEGLDKQLAQIENERRLAIQKANENGTKAGEIIMQLNIKYDQKILDQKRKWAADVIKIYEDMLARIEQVNKQTFEIEVDTATQNTEMKQSEALRRTGYEMITPSTYDDTKALEAYYKKVMDIEKKYLDIQTEIQRESLEKQLDYTKAEEELRHRRATDPNDNEFLQQLKAGKITQEQYDKLIEDENTAHAARMNAIDKKYASDLKKITEENLQETQKLYTEYFDSIVNDISSERSKIDEIMSQPLITDDDGWGIVNIGKNRQRFKQALSQYDELKNNIIEKEKELKKALETSGITAEDFAIEQKALDDEMKVIDNAVRNVKDASKGLLGDFFQSIQQYVQAVGQAATSIISSIGEINQAAFERQLEAIEKQTDLLEDQLDKQRELTQKYADDVNDIEDELENSRGDRRQFLIDQLNAQMEAQRESLAQEKRIEKEQERLDKKREQLEYENEMRKWNQSKLTAAINAALAISSAAVNSYPIPAIPMMALAASVGAAQMAAVIAQKPRKYAEGGLLEGRSHAQGGIPVGNSGIEVEGNEFVTNKRTTSQNLALLQFINSKKKKLDLSDMIEFYSSKANKNISNTKTYFADGGQIPVLRNDIDLSDRLITTMEKYSEKPTVVQVVDIINKAENLRQVQALAGLS